MNIQVFKLTSGEDVLGELVNDSSSYSVKSLGEHVNMPSSYSIKNTVGIAVVRGQNGQPNVGLTPFPLHAEQKKDAVIDIPKSSVVYSYVPAEDFINNYNQIFGSGIVLPSKQLITG